MNNNIVVPPTTLAGWHALVSEAEHKEQLVLDHELESYLVFLLMRFTERAEFADSILALDFLSTLKTSGNTRHDLLRDVGDKCLLYAGLFPRRAEKRHVPFRYFVDLGQMAYSTLSDLQHEQLAPLYKALTEGFVLVMDVLLAIREMACQQHLLPLEAEAIWRDTGSRVAYGVLQRYCQQSKPTIPSIGNSQRLH